MGYREYLLWCRYRKKYGPLNPVRMFDVSGAIVAAQINNAHGGKAKPKDFIPYGMADDESNGVSVQTYIEAAFGGKVLIGKRNKRR